MPGAQKGSIRRGSLASRHHGYGARDLFSQLDERVLRSSSTPKTDPGELVLLRVQFCGEGVRTPKPRKESAAADSQATGEPKCRSRCHPPLPTSRSTCRFFYSGRDSMVPILRSRIALQSRVCWGCLASKQFRGVTAGSRRAAAKWTVDRGWVHDRQEGGHHGSN